MIYLWENITLLINRKNKDFQWSWENHQFVSSINTKRCLNPEPKTKLKEIMTQTRWERKKIRFWFSRWLTWDNPQELGGGGQWTMALPPMCASFSGPSLHLSWGISAPLGLWPAFVYLQHTNLSHSRPPTPHIANRTHDLLTDTPRPATMCVRQSEEINWVKFDLVCLSMGAMTLALVVAKWNSAWFNRVGKWTRLGLCREWAWLHCGLGTKKCVLAAPSGEDVWRVDRRSPLGHGV